MSIKITRAAIEAGARALRDMVPEAMFTPYHTYLEQAKACITTALPHLQPTIQATPAPSSLAESAGEGGLNSDCKVSTQNVQSPPATATDVAIDGEVERVARAIHDAPRSHGVRPWSELSKVYTDAYMSSARAAIRAIREGGERWGVWCENIQEWLLTYGEPPTPFVTTDPRAASHLAKEWNSRMGFDTDEGASRRAIVLPYTPARAKTPDWEEAMKAAEEVYPTNETYTRGELLMRFARKFAAIRDASKGGQDGK